MSRGVGETEFLREILPAGSWIVFGVLTQLGDTWFLGVLLVGLYWFYDRTALAVPMAYGLSGASLVVGLKEVFGFARPPHPIIVLENIPVSYHGLYEAIATASGYGFPSGHAIMSTIVYLSLVQALTVSTHRRRLTVAIAIITLVGISRIALGVHFLVDVVLGILVGIVFLALADSACEHWETEQPTVAFGIALGLSVVTWIAVGPISETTLVLGAALGAFGAWQLVELRIAAPTTEPVRGLLRDQRVRWFGIIACVLGLLFVDRVGQLVGIGTAAIILVPWTGIPGGTLLRQHTS